MRYLTYDQETELYSIHEAKCHPKKPELVIELIRSSRKLEDAIECLKRLE